MSLIKGLPTDLQARLETLDPSLTKKPANTVRPLAVPANGNASSRKTFSTEERVLLYQRGEWSQIAAGDGSQSAGDLAFCSMLAKMCNGDHAAIDAAFRKSGMMRPKWDERHGADTYGNLTIGEALKNFKVTALSVRITCHTLKDTKAAKTEWVVEGRLPRGMLTYMFAPKGRGKTKLCNHWNKLVNDQGMRVIRFNMEDSEDAILKPCLHAAGCNENLTSIVDKSALIVSGDTQMTTSVNFSEPSHIAALKKLVEDLNDVRLVMIEPINNYKGKAKAVSEDDMRPIYQNLANLAEELKIAILVVSHTNRKHDVDVQEKSHGAGSSIHVARVNWFLDKDHHGGAEDRLLTDAGSNIPIGKSLAFKITQVPPFELDGVKFDKIAIASNFEDSDVTADEAVEDGESPARKSQANHIATWLGEFLIDGGEANTSLIYGAAKKFNPDWTQENIRQVFSRRFLGKQKKGYSRTEGAGKNKVTYWGVGSLAGLMNGCSQSISEATQ